MPTDPDAPGSGTGGDIGGLRRRIDEIDASLAGLLQRRAELTAAVQRRKLARDRDAWPPPRDPDRERQIAEAMSELAPSLGVERLARIMDVVIAESIAAGTEGLRGSGGRVT